MVSLVARQGRELQRYSDKGHRLVVGCIPYKLEWDKTGADGIAFDRALQVLVISAQKGEEMLFPRGGWESDESEEEATSREAMEEAGVLGNVEKELGRWSYQSKSHDAHKMGVMFPLSVTEELHQWPEMGNRRRRWVTVAGARETCRQAWMLEALDILVGRLSSALRARAAPPPRSIVADQPWEEEDLGKLKRGRIVLAKEPESPAARKKKPRQLYPPEPRRRDSGDRLHRRRRVPRGFCGIKTADFFLVQLNCLLSTFFREQVCRIIAKLEEREELMVARRGLAWLPTPPQHEPRREHRQGRRLAAGCASE